MDAVGKVESKTSGNFLKAENLLYLLLAVAFTACYFTTFIWFNHKYNEHDTYYSHGYLIPFVAAYMIYSRRAAIRNTEVTSSNIGIAIIVLALLMHIFGHIALINFVSGFSMVLYLAGCSLYHMGAKRTRFMIFPIGFLIFMCPIPENLINHVSLPLKAIATSLALRIVDIAGIPYIREGFRIVLADSTFIIGTPCNGMRSLISFLALGFVFLWFMKASFWKKSVFIAITIPLSVALNGIRIAILLFIAHFFGQEAASPESWLHDGSGIFVFIIGMIFLMGLYRVSNDDKS